MTDVDSKNPYDEYPYPNFSHSHTHPERMQTLASMLGMKPAPSDNCRVLELGCAAGFNLFPMAYALPNSHFVGLDYSSIQIDYGLERLEELELPNVELKCMDIKDVHADFGLFDYIIVHGIYSWVPPFVRDRIMEVCRQNLAPEGVAYISYNTNPGCAMMGVVRAMMLYRVRDIEEPLEKAREAKKLIEFLSESIGTEGTAYGAYLAKYLELIEEKRMGSRVQDGSLILHDELEDFNDPVYFYQFAKHAAEYGLQYLVETDFSNVVPSKFPAEVGKHIREISQNTIDVEQYLDFLNFRNFRRTLLCHQEVQVNRTFTPETVFEMHLLSQADRAADPPEDLSKNMVQFQGQDGANFTTDHPLTVAALDYLGDTYPNTTSFHELLDIALEKVSLEHKESAADHAKLMAANFMRAFSYSESLIEFHIQPANRFVEITEMPEVSPIARWQLDYMVNVTNMRHERVELDSFSRQLLRYLDGNHNREKLLARLALDYQEGKINLGEGDIPAAGTREAEELIKAELDHYLAFFARASLLIG